MGARYEGWTKRKNEVQGKIILYPHIRPAPLTRVEHWSLEDEERYLEENL